MTDPINPIVSSSSNLQEIDLLTGLHNRYRLTSDLERLLDVQGARPGDGALILVDIDDHRKVNDTYGYRFGDRIVKAVADTIRRILPNGANLYRIGGDAFAVLWAGAAREQAHLFAVSLLAETRKPHRIAGVSCSTTVSIGTAFFPADGDTAESLFRCADITLYRVKRRGKNGAAFYSPEERDQFMSHIDLESDLRTSVEAGFQDFEVYYQPTVDAVSGVCNGAEALLRWTSPKNVRIAPADVVMHLELIGCVEQVGDWVLQQAIEQCAAWRAGGLDDFSVHVNLSMLQLRERVLEDKLMFMLESAGLSPSALVLEVTESAIMNDLTNSIAILNAIRKHGVRIALDDFGTGYSSINYLRKLPIDQIKIDRSFVADIANTYNKSLANTIKDLAHSIQLSVCDEGIEEKSQYDRLEPSQGDIIQGYLFGKPMPVDIFQTFLRDNRRGTQKRPEAV
ncbi:MAG: EAL domain-containing protein [Clostridia bacterium]|nr:EAL domain-containing protein [Clostridia bacterium]